MDVHVKMFAEMTEAGEISMDFDADTMKHFTDFLYTGCVPDCDSIPRLLELARMARYYEIPELQSLCMYYLSSIFVQSTKQACPRFDRFDFETHLICDRSIRSAYA